MFTYQTLTIQFSFLKTPAAFKAGLILNKITNDAITAIIPLTDETINLVVATAATASHLLSNMKNCKIMVLEIYKNTYVAEPETAANIKNCTL